MRTCSILRSQLLNAWHATINGEYSEQLINSERGLQVYFCRHLIEQFRDSQADWRLFIEPRMSFPTVGRAKYPDIVICHNRSIIGVVEVKYQPRAKPSFIKDLETLNLILENGDDARLSNDRYRGERLKPHEYSLAPDAVLCWAGVYKAPQAEILHPGALSINERLSVLSAITETGKKAHLHPLLSPRK